MTEVRVYTHALEGWLFGPLQVRIFGVRMDKSGKLFFEVEGPDVPPDAGILVAHTVRFENHTLEPVGPTG
jgi:hypothetical protein